MAESYEPPNAKKHSRLGKQAFLVETMHVAVWCYV